MTHSIHLVHKNYNSPEMKNPKTWVCTGVILLMIGIGLVLFACLSIAVYALMKAYFYNNVKHCIELSVCKPPLSGHIKLMEK